MQQHTGTVKTLRSSGFPQHNHCTSAVTSSLVLLPVKLVLTGILVTLRALL